MKIAKLISYSAIALIAIYFFSCTKDNNAKPPPPEEGSVAGVITDLSNNPVNNATVIGGTATTTTDANGKFTLTNVQFTADTVLVNVTKDGFFQGSKSFVSTTNTVNNAKIQLISKPAPSSITASSGGDVAISGGGSVNFIGGFVNASNGNAYTGNVSVSTIYLNSTDPNFSASVPGNLKGVSVTNQQGVLQSFGVLAVELNDASGNKLQLAQGKTATITLPIPAALLGNAPVSIPLWYFDDVKGWWKEEGTATKQGNNYVGVVKHFSFWNVGDISGTVTLTASFTDSISGAAFANKLVSIIRLDSTTTSENTDITGTVSGLVPVNEMLIMRVFGDCGAMVYSSLIGPFSKDTVLDNIKIFNGCSQAPPDTTQYIHLTINGVDYSWYPPNYKFSATRIDTGSSSHTSINVDSTTFPRMYILCTIIHDNAPPGNVPVGNYPFSLYTILDGVTYDTYYPNSNSETNVTEYGGVDGYVIGSASGWLKNYPTPTTDSIPFTCTYRAKRIQ
jgi:hypothetical protein